MLVWPTALALGRELTQAGDWCTQANAIRQYADCDGDSILDWVCVESYTTARGAIRSSAGCYSDDGHAGWPTAPDSYCPSSPLFLGWCTQENAILQSTECDGDGILDWICTESSTTARGVVRSSNGCSSDEWTGATGWPTAPNSYCPSSSLFLTCPRPNYWCDPTEANNNGNWTLRQADCDGDGIVDLVCTDMDGRRGVIRSASGCQIDDAITGWPSIRTHQLLPLYASSLVTP
ncbi:hypothetical protein TSOC_003236 [Tetrabaena socialis]|uniref:Uncharacterized protein n=1 Tax=Tetrabaena socialis TaxID=47790 RepID=A0A2J8AC08_9CHLO|nr:hypothetical protein TSOC_003236 [Tetrabaena socialis]|eukprot:PNH10055.1 hypothetical protein TSOC_003236 [Tetrabaena socialis]